MAAPRFDPDVRPGVLQFYQRTVTEREADKSIRWDIEIAAIRAHGGVQETGRSCSEKLPLLKLEHYRLPEEIEAYLGGEAGAARPGQTLLQHRADLAQEACDVGQAVVSVLSWRRTAHPTSQQAMRFS